MSIECIKAARYLKKYNINCEVLDLRVLRPLDSEAILKTIKKTKKLLVVDNGLMKFGISSEIISTVIDQEPVNNFSLNRIGLLDAPIASSRALAKYSYPTYISIMIKVFEILRKKIPDQIKKNPDLFSKDQPDLNFKGPF